MEYDYSKQYNKITAAERLAALGEAERYIQVLKPYLPKNKSAKILEIGPGNGLTIKLLNELGYSSVLGLEVDKSLANQAREQQINVEYVPTEILHSYIATVPEAYDLVYGMHVIEHVPKHSQLDFLRAIFKCLRSGGYLVFETPNALGAASNYYRYNDWTHQLLFTTDSLQFLFENSDFVVRYVGAAVEGYMRRGGKISSFLKAVILRILRGIFRTILRLNYLAEAGLKGAKMPLTTSLLIVGQKS